MDGISIRRIAIEDNVAVAELIRKVLLEMGVPKVGSAYADKGLDDMYNEYKTDRSAYFLAEQNGLLLGCAGIAPLKAADDATCELQKMYILEEARGKGLGKQLMAKCLDHAIYLGFKYCYLETMPHMQAAQKLYTNFGFKYLESPKGDTGHHACQVYMLKEL
ncbi:MAG: GNAT family N-acetyltransferase [Croceitalea sp.]|nr:GNAT family N-acetyltransferase [Croceitalea sp.]NNL08595.1 GNAT family N-acetyltransferase [Croceitalea sp.]